MTIDFARVQRLTIWVGVAAAAGAFFRFGALNAAGVLLGTGLSVYNFRWYRSLSGAIGSSRGPATPLLALRYLILGGAVYVIFRLTGISPAAVLAGLLANVAALSIEIFYRALFDKHGT